MKAELYWILLKPRRLGICPRPRGGDYLDDEIASLKNQGVDVLVSLLTDEERAELDLTDEGEICARHGVEFVSFPIPDRSLPQNDSDARRLIDRLDEALFFEWKGVAIHCRAGIGRSSMIAAALLAHDSLTYDVDKAFDLIARIRGCEVPDTPHQREWVMKFLGQS